MLTYGQLKFNFLFYKICHKFCLLPLQLDHLTFRPTYGLRYYVWILQYFLSSAHGIFTAIRLLQLLLVNRKEINLVYFAIHAGVALAGILQCMYYRILITHKESHLMLCNELLLQVQQSADEKYGLYRLGKDLLYFWKFSVPEILLLLFPFVMFSTPAVVSPGYYILQHDSPLYLYSLCPQEYRSIQTVILLGVPELWLIGNLFTTTFHLGFVTAAHLQKSIDICKRETARLRRGAAVMQRKVVRSYREFLLQTQLYNSLCSGAVYLTKLLFMTMAILGLFITIRFGHEVHFLITSINFVIGVLGVFLYTFFYDAAVWMPIKFDDLKRSLYFFLTKEDVQDRANLRRELASLPAVELRVGSFDSFKRTSIPEFIHFVVQQICSLLLTFR